MKPFCRKFSGGLFVRGFEDVKTIEEAETILDCRNLKWDGLYSRVSTTIHGTQVVHCLVYFIKDGFDIAYYNTQAKELVVHDKPRDWSPAKTTEFRRV